MILNLGLLVLFQNCSPTEEAQYGDSSFVDDALSVPEVHVTLNAPCNGQYNNKEFYWGNTIAICIMKAGSNPRYCINKDGVTPTCFHLSGEPGWSRSNIHDTWTKTYPFSADPSKYFAHGLYTITVRDTVDTTSSGTYDFRVR